MRLESLYVCARFKQYVIMQAGVSPAICMIFGYGTLGKVQFIVVVRGVEWVVVGVDEVAEVNGVGTGVAV